MNEQKTIEEIIRGWKDKSSKEFPLDAANLRIEILKTSVVQTPSAHVPLGKYDATRLSVAPFYKPYSKMYCF